MWRERKTAKHSKTYRASKRGRADSREPQNMKGIPVKPVALILLSAKASIFLIVFGLGLITSPQDTTYLFHRPGQLLRSLLAMNIIMPLVAAALAAAFHLNPAVK